MINKRIHDEKRDAEVGEIKVNEEDERRRVNGRGER